jgi:ligand-binding sensor domain-containing protein
MNKFFLNINHLLLALFFVVTSCNGQVKTDLPKDNINQQTPPIAGVQPKIVRTQGVTSGNITCELQDILGNLWFSTDGEGVYRFDGKSFTNFTTKDGLCDNYTSDIIQDKSGNILIGTNAGVCKYDGKIFSNYFETDTLNKLRIISLYEDRDGNIWFGAVNKGIYRYDGTNLSNLLYKYEHPFLDNKQEKFISDIIQDKNGNIWFSSFNRGGIWRYDGKTVINFIPSADYYLYNENEYIYNESGTYNTSAFSTKYVHSPDYITDDMISSISEDKNGNIWFATRRHGACRYDGKTFTSYSESEGFVSYGITTILEDKKGNIWLGTDKNGVFSYDGKTFKNYTTADGLTNNSVRSILEDKDGNLWFGTRWFGLSRYDGKTFTTFSQYEM